MAHRFALMGVCMCSPRLPPFDFAPSNPGGANINRPASSLPLPPPSSTTLKTPGHSDHFTFAPFLLLTHFLRHPSTRTHPISNPILPNSPSSVFMFSRLFPAPSSPQKSPTAAASTTAPPPPYQHPVPQTKAEMSMAPNSVPSGAVGTHVDVDALIEDYAWRRFKELMSIKGSGLESFKSLEFVEAEFEINRKKLVLLHAQPQYNNIQLTGTRPNTIFKSLFTNNTSQSQTYSLKTERTSESICGVSREQGFMFGAEAELSLKIPGDIADLKTNFKHEIHFNKLTENIKSEMLTWAVDNNILVPAGGQTEASIVIEEMSYNGTYSLVSTLSGMVTIAIRRLRDGHLVLPICANIATIIGEYIQKGDPRLKGVVSMEGGGKTVAMKSKGTCHFQFALKQYVELTELSGYQRRDITKEMARINMLPRN